MSREPMPDPDTAARWAKLAQNVLAFAFVACVALGCASTFIR